MEDGIVLGLVGSPNPKGKTNELVTATLDGAAKAGAPTELIQMSEYVVAACKDCLPWVCASKTKCTYEDAAFDFLSQKIVSCGALVLGSPVYWGDTSGLVRYLILKMHRILARSAPTNGLPAMGIAVAGGTGNGLISGLKPLYHFFYTMQMRGLEPLPATRFDFPDSVARAQQLGAGIAGMAKERRPFGSAEERLLWFNTLPYVGLDRLAERRLLAGVTAASLAVAGDSSTMHGLARADALVAQGHQLEALGEITTVYNAGVRAFSAQSEAAARG